VTVAPKKALGQHFLVDRNILGVVGRLAELRPEDVVLEIGPGLGVLTGYLAERVRLVHAIEIDRSLQTSLEAALEGLDALVQPPGEQRLDPARLQLLVALRSIRPWRRLHEAGEDEREQRRHAHCLASPRARVSGKFSLPSGNSAVSAWMSATWTGCPSSADRPRVVRRLTGTVNSPTGRVGIGP